MDAEQVYFIYGRCRPAANEMSVETCSCPYGCGVDLVYEGCRQWVCPVCDVVLDLEGVEVDDEDE